MKKGKIGGEINDVTFDANSTRELKDYLNACENAGIIWHSIEAKTNSHGNTIYIVQRPANEKK